MFTPQDTDRSRLFRFDRLPGMRIRRDKTKREKRTRTSHRRLLARILLPPPELERARDLVKEGNAREANRRGLLTVTVAYIPLVAVIALTINVAIQMRGRQSIVLAVMQNMSLASLAFVVTVNLLIYLVPGLAYGFAAVATDPSFTARIRRASRISVFVTNFVSVLVLPWQLALIAVLGSLAILRFRHLLVGVGGDSPPEAWLRPPVPVDSELRRLWVEGRQRLRLNGVVVEPLNGISERPTSEPRSLDKIAETISARTEEIRNATRRSTGEAVLWVFGSSLVGYAFAALLMQIQLAPLERVEIDHQETYVGYVFSPSPGSGIFLERDTLQIVPLDVRPLTDRSICAPSGLARTAVSLFAPDRTGAVDCSGSS